MPDLSNSIPSSRTRTIVYWITTIILVLECEVGGIMGGLRLQPFLGTIQHLGYPTYFMTIHTIWYILAGIALLVPRFPRLKEWAYAGLFFIYTGAFMSHLAVGDSPFMLIAPIVFTGLVLVSWALRPPHVDYPTQKQSPKPRTCHWLLFSPCALLKLGTYEVHRCTYWMDHCSIWPPRRCSATSYNHSSSELAARSSALYRSRHSDRGWFTLVFR